METIQDRFTRTTEIMSQFLFFFFPFFLLGVISPEQHDFCCCPPSAYLSVLNVSSPPSRKFPLSPSRAGSLISWVPGLFGSGLPWVPSLRSISGSSSLGQAAREGNFRTLGLAGPIFILLVCSGDSLPARRLAAPSTWRHLSVVISLPDIARLLLFDFCFISL